MAGDELSELSAELRQVEWLGIRDRAAARPLGHTADHWSFELSLVVFGALIGVALYFGVY